MDISGLAKRFIKGQKTDKDASLSRYDLIFIAASPGSGKSYYLEHSAVLRFSHQLKLSLSALHNNSDDFWQALIVQCEERNWISKKRISTPLSIKDIPRLAQALNKYSQQYTDQDNLFLIFDNCHLIDHPVVIDQLVYFTQYLSKDIKCIFSGRNRTLNHVFQNASNQSMICFNDNDLVLDVVDFYQLIMNNLSPNHHSAATKKLINQIYNLVKGHAGLGIRCINSDFIAHLNNDDKQSSLAELSHQLVQTDEAHQYCLHAIEGLSANELSILSLPVLNRSLLAKFHRAHLAGDVLNSELDYYTDKGFFSSLDQIDFYLKPLCKNWLESNVADLKTPIIASAIEQYRKQGKWAEGIECAILLEDWALAIDLVCQASRYFSRQGKYEQGRQLIRQLPKTEKYFTRFGNHDVRERESREQESSEPEGKIKNQQLLLLALFENLLDFQQYGHQVASDNLKRVLHDYPENALDQQNKELIALLEHHYSFLIQPNSKTKKFSTIFQYTWLFDPSNELCAWAWHSLAMEQVLTGDLVNGFESILKAIYWSFEQEDAPCALASLAWIIVPCLHLGKLSFALDYCSRVEQWLQEKHLSNTAMVSTIHRVRLLIYREQGHLDLAQHELKMMQTFYPKLDPLNLAYCYWAEFLLSLAQQNFELARKQLMNLQAHGITHFNGWQLALPKPELLTAILDNLAGSELAMLNWASQFQLQHIDDDAWINQMIPSMQSEVIAYIRVRIVLGSDMAKECEYLLAKAESDHDKLLSIHVLILLVLNAARQDKLADQKEYRHQLLITAASCEFQQIYKEYLDDLLPLIITEQPLPSELMGYNKIVPSAALKPNIDCQPVALQVERVNDRLFLVLTPREKQIAQQVLAGHSNKEIADNLAIGLVTVKGHVSNIFNKLGIKRRAQLANLVSSHRHSFKTD